jgi:hypothetical protein
MITKEILPMLRINPKPLDSKFKGIKVIIKIHSKPSNIRDNPLAFR